MTCNASREGNPMTSYGQPMPQISADDKRSALHAQLWVTGIAFESDGKQLFLKCAFHTGHIQTVMLDPPRTADLFWYLKRLLEELPESDGSPSSLSVDTSGATMGRHFPHEDDTD
jgi:hypothetical protein